MKIPTPDEFTKAGGYRPFPGKWSRWLNAVREEILSAQPVAGRHVTIAEHPGKGTVINVDDTSTRRQGGVGIIPPPPPGCAGCALPGGNCPHALGIVIQFDDTDTGSQDFLEFIDEPAENSGIYAFYSVSGSNHVIEVAAWGSGGFVDFNIPTSSFFNVPISICIQFSRVDNSTVNVDVSITGYGSGSFTMDTPGPNPNTLYVGSHNGSGASHRTISCLSVLANPDSSEDDFNFPPDSFDSFAGGASIVGGVLRIDADSGDAYALKTISPYDLDCPVITGACCVEADCSIQTESDCGDMSGTYQGDDTTCDPNPCPQPTGACCCDGVCNDLTEAACALLDCETGQHEFKGTGTVCTPFTCIGACCFTDNCELIGPDVCLTDGGIYQGDGTLCTDILICGEGQGACCNYNGSGMCVVTYEQDCLNGSGTFLGSGTGCAGCP